MRVLKEGKSKAIQACNPGCNQSYTHGCNSGLQLLLSTPGNLGLQWMLDANYGCASHEINNPSFI
jgi:hypothetical protein